MTAPQIPALGRREHVVGGGVEERGAAAGVLRAVAGDRVDWRPVAARGDREFVMAARCRGA